MKKTTLRHLLFWSLLFFTPAAGRAEGAVFARDIAVTPHPLATRAAVEAYARGGNAMDAAAAAAFALGVVEPHNSGLGGGGFLLAYDARDRSLRAFDYRETAPALSARAVYEADGARDGWKAAAVPGLLAGIAMALSDHGTFPLARALEPAIRLADEGFAVTPLLAREIADRADCLKASEGTRAVYFASRRAPRAGDRLIQKDLAATLRTVAKNGPASFYRGKVADAIDRASRAEGGFLRKSDLKKYRAVERKPFAISFRGYDIRTMPLPSSGGVLMKTMFAVAGDTRAARDPAALAAAMKVAFAERAALGDPDFSPDSSKNTTHATFADRSGNVVAMTHSLNLPFGSCVTVPGTGILLNDHMDDFTTRPDAPNAFGLVQGAANRVEAGKRPLSSMSPTIVFKDGRPVYALGTPGGPTIITNVFQTLVNRIDRRMPLQAAIDAPKIHHQFSPDVVRTQRGYPTTAIRALRGAGFTVESGGDWGNLQAVELDWEDRQLIGASDRRGEGDVGFFP